MSLIKLQGNASGTGAFTIAAPNSNTDRTLTLPDATGTVNVSGLANEVPAGSAGAPAIYSTGDTNTGIFFPAADTIAFAEGGSEAARFDSSGNLLVGVTSQFGSGKLCITGSQATIATKGNTSTNGGGWSLIRADNNSKCWEIVGNADNIFVADADFSHYAYLVQNPTSWQFGSDARIKTNIEELDYGLETVMAMQPKRYTFTQSGKVDIGFIAQELRLVVPEAVSGTELPFDEADTKQERAAKTLGVGKETLIPILVKAMQEQQAQIEELKAEVAALKGASA